MKKLFIVIFLSIVFLTLESFANDRKFGAGIMLGEPTGLSFQSRHDRFMYDFGFSWDFDDEFTMIADYKVRSSDFISRLIGRPAPNAAAYVGIGAFLDYEKHRRHDDWEAGVRIPVGLEYMFAEAPIGVFLELAPTVQLIEEVDLGMMGALGGRYYF
jgi:hypothetical protein